MKIKLQREIEKDIDESSTVIKNLVTNISDIEMSIRIITKCLENGNKIILFGNGGSAADAQHTAAEFVGRFRLERRSLPALALTTDTSILTSISNDYSFDIVFSRQCESMVSKGDTVIGISTSGNSINVKKGLEMSKKKGAKIIALLGNKGGIIRKTSDISIIVRHSSTPRIQEGHRTILHIICDKVEKNLTKRKIKNGQKRIR